MRESITLCVDVGALLTALRRGQVVDPCDLEHLQRLANAVRYHAARASHDLAKVPQIERRNVAAPAPALPTPLICAPA